MEEGEIIKGINMFHPNAGLVRIRKLGNLNLIAAIFCRYEIMVDVNTSRIIMDKKLYV